MVRSDCDKAEIVAKAFNYSMYIIFAILVIVLGLMFNYTVKTKYNSEHFYHQKQTNRYMFWLLLSLIIKYIQGKELLSFSTSTLAIQPLSELVLILLFSVFKKDEDCFQCLSKCEQLEIYSIF